MTDYDEKNAGFPAKYRGLPTLPPGREKAGLQEWEEKAMSELAKHGLGDAVEAVAVPYEAVANSRLGDKIQKLYGLLMCPSEGPLRAEPELLQVLREKCGKSAALRLHGARLFAMLVGGVRVLPEPEEVSEARRLALRNLLHGGLTPNTTGKEVTAHLRKVARAMLDVPEEEYDEVQWRAYLRRIVPPGSQARQRRAWETELAKLDSEAGVPLEGVSLRMAFVRWWTTESNAIALHNALPSIGGGSSGLREAASPDAALIAQVLAAAQEEQKRKAAAASFESEEEEPTWPALGDDDDPLDPEFVDMETMLLANKATVCICNYCGFVHIGGDQPDEYCWGKKGVVRDPGAEARLKQRDPKRLEFLNALREQDRAGTAGQGVSTVGASTGAPRSRPTGAAAALSAVNLEGVAYLDAFTAFSLSKARGFTCRRHGGRGMPASAESDRSLR